MPKFVSDEDDQIGTFQARRFTCWDKIYKRPVAYEKPMCRRGRGPKRDPSPCQAPGNGIAQINADSGANSLPLNFQISNKTGP